MYVYIAMSQVAENCNLHLSLTECSSYSTDTLSHCTSKLAQVLVEYFAYLGSFHLYRLRKLIQTISVCSVL